MERNAASPTETLEEARTQILAHHLEVSRRNRFSLITTEVVLLIFIVRICVRTCTCKCICVCVCAFMSVQNTFFPLSNFEGASQSLLHLFQSILPPFPPVPPPPCHFYRHIISSQTCSSSRLNLMLILANTFFSMMTSIQCNTIHGP